MARKVSSNKNKLNSNGPKKTRIGNGKFSKHGHKGGGPGGSRPSGTYRKKRRGQGRR